MISSNCSDASVSGTLDKIGIEMEIRRQRVLVRLPAAVILVTMKKENLFTASMTRRQTAWRQSFSRWHHFKADGQVVTSGGRVLWCYRARQRFSKTVANRCLRCCGKKSASKAYSFDVTLRRREFAEKAIVTRCAGRCGMHPQQARGCHPLAFFPSHGILKVMSTQELVKALEWRYATKRFDPSKKIPADTWQALERALILTPTSYGLQPYRFYVLTDPAKRAELLAHSWKQPQVTDCSHYVVLRRPNLKMTECRRGQLDPSHGRSPESSF